MPSFFSDLPHQPEPREPEEWTPPPWFQPPRDELPGLVTSTRLLARTSRVALALDPIEVYSTGVVIPVRVIVRRVDETAAEWQDLTSGVFGHAHRSTPLDALRFGVALPDGGRVTTDGPPLLDLETPPLAALQQHGGGGSGDSRRVEQSARLWLWPTPPGGSIELVTMWTALGVPETRTPLDGDAIAAARADVLPLWPDPDEHRAEAPL